jgi:uncharacterized membrane protein YhaH (DUF805 family)/glutaredoxin
MSDSFRVVLTGKSLSGIPVSALKSLAAQAFSITEQQAERMLSGQAVVVAQKTTREGAEKLLARLKAIDLGAIIEPMPAMPAVVAVSGESKPPSPPAEPVSAAPEPIAAPEVETMSCPKCGEIQPRRTLCRACSVDMPRYEAAQREMERERQEARQREREARQAGGSVGRASRSPAGDSAGVIGIGFSGRLGRMDYFAGSMLSNLIGLLFVAIALKTGKMFFVWTGFALALVYGVRCMLLRLHDLEKNGWLMLLLFIPVVDVLMMLWLGFWPGDADDNEYGSPPQNASGKLVLISLVLSAGLLWSIMAQLQKDPMSAVRLFPELVGEYLAQPDDDEDAGPATASTRYAKNNRIDFYQNSGCNDCARVRAWLDTNGLTYTVYAVDSDQSAAERLHSILSGLGLNTIQLPVLEVNGKVLTPNPSFGEISQKLRKE